MTLPDMKRPSAWTLHRELKKEKNIGATSVLQIYLEKDCEIYRDFCRFSSVRNDYVKNRRHSN